MYVSCFIISVHRGSQVTLNVLLLMEKVYGYESPTVEIIEVQVEKGFAGSGIGEGYLPGNGEYGDEM